MKLPSREEIDRLLLDQVYAGPVLNNSHRGDIVEMMVGFYPVSTDSSVKRNRSPVRRSSCLSLSGL